MLGDQDFKYADEVPSWVDLLRNAEQSSDSDEHLNSILSESGLKGVAYFGFR